MKLTRKELAQFITVRGGDAVSVFQVQNNEQAWGLKKARGKDKNRRTVRYDKEIAIKGLIKAGVIPA